MSEDATGTVVRGAALVSFLSVVVVIAGYAGLGARTLQVGGGAVAFGVALLAGGLAGFVRDRSVVPAVVLGVPGTLFAAGGAGVLSGNGPANLQRLVFYGVVLWVVVVVGGAALWVRYLLSNADSTEN